MIYDQVGSDFLIKFFNEKECKILHTRFEEINVSILLMSIFKFYKENLKLSKKYVYQYIHYVKPQLIITYIDNNISYYKLKEKFKDITIIAVQNGVRTDFVKFFENVTKKDNLSIDYLFVMDEITNKCY